MNWFRRDSPRVAFEKPTPSTAISSPVTSVEDESTAEDASRQDALLPTGQNSSSAVLCRGIKRKAEDDLSMSDDNIEIVYNSSGVCPDIACKHNYRVTKSPPKEHLLHLPSPIQQLIYSFVLVADEPFTVLPDGKMLCKPKVFYKIRDHNRLIKKEQKKRDGSPLCAAPGLLLVCKQVRALAVPIFYVGNSFDVHISNFYGEGIMDWWKRVEAQRMQKPIMLANSSGLDRNTASGTNLSAGTVTLDVAYEPNWQNLVTWLNACIRGDLPRYKPTDLRHHPEGFRLQTVAWLFEILDQYSSRDWQAFDKTIATHRGHLNRDDARWAVDDVLEDEMVLSDTDHDDFASSTGPYCEVTSPVSSRTVASKSQYQASRETLSSSFLTASRKQFQPHISAEDYTEYCLRRGREAEERNKVYSGDDEDGSNIVPASRKQVRSQMSPKDYTDHCLRRGREAEDWNKLYSSDDADESEQESAQGDTTIIQDMDDFDFDAEFNKPHDEQGFVQLRQGSNTADKDCEGEAMAIDGAGE